MASSPSPVELAKSYLGCADPSGPEARQQLRHLCEAATATDPVLARQGTDAIFREIVEPLAERFDRPSCDLYLQFFSQVVDSCRRQPGGESLDAALTRFGLRGESDFLQRAQRVRDSKRVAHGEAKRVKKILVPSRVTLGADVAVTSVLLNRLKRAFPEAEILFFAGPKSASLFASDSRIRSVESGYEREGVLLERLHAWLLLTQKMGREIRGLPPEEYLVVDPDSRLTQLGLLPVTDDDSRYLFFESRSYWRKGFESLAELAGSWLDEVLGPAPQPSLPYVSLPGPDRERGEAVRHSIKGRLAAVNLGVGGNAAKRIDGRFEQELLLALVDAGYTILLDRGFGKEELARTARLLEALRASGRSVAVLSEPASAPSKVNAWEGSLSGFAGLIGVSDLYVGYDSAGGHLAAALGIPGIVIFAGAPSARFRRRWTPWGRRPAQVVAVPPSGDTLAILARIRERLP